MHEITIEHEFCAAHAITIRGEREPLHGHNWRVHVTVASESLDADGLVCDFHEVHARVKAIVAPYDNRCLNELPPFDRVNPTAERVAEFIALELARRHSGPSRVASVRVSEAPGCWATWKG